MRNKEEFKSIANKLELLENSDLLRKYIITTADFFEMVELLEDSEKLQLINTDFFNKQYSQLKKGIVERINDDKIKIQLLQDEEFISNNFPYQYQLREIVMSLSEQGKVDALKNQDFLKKMQIDRLGTIGIIESLDVTTQKNILLDKELLQQLNLGLFEATSIIQKMNDEKIKLELMSEIDFNAYQKSSIVQTLSKEGKINEILNPENNFKVREIIAIINSMKIDEIVDFMTSNEDFLKGKKISAFDVVRARYDAEKQLEVVYSMDRLNLSDAEKRKIIAGLKNETKEKLDLSKIDENYVELTKLKIEGDLANVCAYGKIKPDLNSDLAVYKDLDELIFISGIKDVKTDEQRQKLKELCAICPEVRIRDDLELSGSTGQQYLEAEEWIDSELNKLEPDWTDVQKLAYVNTAIGKRLSYTPEQGTEVEDSSEQRNLWEIVAKKNGVCNGIAQLEQYMLGRIGIESERVSSGCHSFLMVKDIGIPTEDGIKKGNTLVDPTWDLASSRYDARPLHFCKNYEELRKSDIDDDGKDHECHKNDELESAELIEMDEKSLRALYTSIGIARENGDFPIVDMIEKTEKINELATDIDTNISNKFRLLKSKCPEFAECMKSSMKMMQGILFEKNEKFDYKRCIASRVYDKSDAKKKSVMFLYFDLEDKGKRFYYADKNQGKFVQLPKEEFEEKFDCYETDMKDNKRLWEQETEIEERMENSSGKIVESDERE